jgi:hypothetical protein
MSQCRAGGGEAEETGWRNPDQKRGKSKDEQTETTQGDKGEVVDIEFELSAKNYISTEY